MESIPVESIPVVDFSAFSILLSDEQLNKESCQETADQIVKAFETIGFVYLSNTGVSKQLLESARETGKKFFGQPESVKSKYKHDENWGWIALSQEGTGDGDLKEAFNVTLKGLNDNSPNWPTEVPEVKHVSPELFMTCARLSRRILTAVAVGLRLPDINFFNRCHHLDTVPSGTMMRYLIYPPLTNDREYERGQLRLGEHTDFGTITLIFQDDIGGLQVKNTDGQWLDAVPIPDTALVNIGDLLQRWTSDRLISTQHRILFPEDEARRKTARQSLAFFSHPDPDYVVEPIDGSQKYPPIAAMEYLRDRLATIL